jgi:rubrerythrin
MSKKIVDVAPLMEYYRNRLLEEGDNPALEDALKRLRELKDDTDSLRPVGHWTESICLDDAFWVCSNCKFPSQASAAPELYRYCPNCGARMEETE